MRNKYKYQFFYEDHESYKQHKCGVKECKMPKRTKLWKELMRRFNNGDFRTIGYELHPNQN